MNNPKCNHCDYEFDSDDTWHGQYSVGEISKDDCEVSKVKCPSCGEEFHTMCVHRYTFSTVDKDGDEL